MPDSNSQVAKRVEHTPGPWAYHSWGEKASGKRFSVETADHKHGIASIAPNINASTLLTMEQHEANARLIVAAPELLEALETAILRSGFYINGPTHPDVCEDEGDPRWVGFARAAIAKARGQ